MTRTLWPLLALSLACSDKSGDDTNSSGTTIHRAKSVAHFENNI